MATQVDIGETNISARQMTEFFRLAALSGHVNQDTFQAYLEKRNPFGDSHVVQATTAKFIINIPPNLTLTQMVELGKYNWANENVKAKFESDPTLVGMWEYELVDPQKSISSEQANRLCSEDGWQSAQVDHLLMFGSIYPSEQQQRRIVGLGSSCQMSGHRRVPVLNGDDRCRDLHLYYWGCVWNLQFVFLRVRRLSA